MGRPSKGRRVQFVCRWPDDGLLDEVDMDRGEQPRDEWMAEAARRRLRGRRVAKAEPQGVEMPVEMPVEKAYQEDSPKHLHVMEPLEGTPSFWEAGTEFVVTECACGVVGKRRRTK